MALAMGALEGVAKPTYSVICSWRVTAREQAKIQAAMQLATSSGQALGVLLFSYVFHDANASGLGAALPFNVAALLMFVVFVGTWTLACADSRGCWICTDRPYGRRTAPAAEAGQPESTTDEEMQPLTREPVDTAE
eukprot:COSAG01_NODE_15772_length_1301_cov_1.183028_1_plen_136_part_00